MPPKTKTVGAYIEHERRWRGRSARIDKELRREWVAKTPQQQTAIIRRLTEAYNARAIVRAQEPMARFALERFREAEPYSEDQTLLFRERLKEAITQYGSLSFHQTSEKKAWLQLAIELGLQGSDQRSIDSTNRLGGGSDTRASAWQCTTEVLNMQRRMERPPLPESSPGRRRMPEKWLSGKTKNARVQRKLFSESHNGSIGLRPMNAGDGTWFAQKLMAADQAKVAVWLMVDESGRVVDRLARKEHFYDFGNWLDARKFFPNPRDEATRMPWEIITHEAVANVPNLSSVVGLYEASSRRWSANVVRKHTMYLEWFPRGDLHQVIKTHKDSGVPVPEPMIWYVAESLAKCVLAMEKGHCDPDRTGKVDAWEPVVHRDLKPGNVFLGNPVTARYPQYPRPAIGDFGYGIRTSKDDPLNPSWHVGCGTEGYLAPESYLWVDRDSGKPIDRDIKISSAVDVCGIGMILYCLVKRETRPTQPLWLGNGEEDTMLSFTDDDKAVYTHHLLEVIEACLSFKPNKRPSPKELIELINFYTKGYEQYTPEGEANPHTKGMVDMFDDPSEEVMAANALSCGQDAYTIGMNREELPDEL